MSEVRYLSHNLTAQHVRYLVPRPWCGNSIQIANARHAILISLTKLEFEDGFLLAASSRKTLSIRRSAGTDCLSSEASFLQSDRILRSRLDFRRERTEP